LRILLSVPRWQFGFSHSPPILFLGR
jgi:hypothetical protein